MHPTIPFPQPTFTHDTLPIIVSYLIVLGLIIFWYQFMKHLVPPDESADAPIMEPPTFSQEPWLHRFLTWVCGFLFIGLIIEGAATFAYILTVHGIMIGVNP